MAGKSAIQWTGHTWNPIVGCSILTPGCKLCYAMGEAARQIRCAAGLGRETHYAGTVEIVKGKPVWTGKLAQAPESILLAPLRRKKPTTYFVNSMGDLFHEDCPDEWIDKVFAVMALSPQHTFQVLTKRAERMRDYLSAAGLLDRLHNAACRLDSPLGASWAADFHSGHDAGMPLPNVWLGVSTERQQEADERIPLLLQTPAAVRFISAEPLLGPIDLHPTWLNCIFCRGRGYVLPTFAANHFVPCDECLKWARAGGLTILPGQQATPGARLGWIITGGESGKGARPSNPQWYRDIRDQCAAAGVPYFHKQNGEWLHRDRVNISREHGAFNADGSFDRGLSWPVAQQCLKTHVVMERVGKKAAGRHLDGVLHDAMPSTTSIPST